MQQPAANAALAFLNTILNISYQQKPGLLNIKQNSRNGEIPRHQRSRDSNRLLHRKHPPPWRTRLGDGARDSLRLSRKPPREAQRILDLTLCFREWLARLVRDDLRQVVPVLADQGVPLEEPSGAGPWVYFPVALEGGVRCVYGAVNVLGVVIWCACPDFAGAGVC